MDRQKIEALVRRWATEGVAEGREEVFDEILSDDVVDTSGTTAARGRDSFKARARMVRGALAERTVVVEGLVVEGDFIAWRWALTGTHAATFLDVAPTGKRVTLRGVNFQRLQDGRVAEHWTLADLAGLARQLRDAGGAT